MAGKRLLIIDADPSSLMFLDVNLSKFGFEVITAETTERGLLLANQKKPHLIICDLNVGKMNGIEFCWIVRETSKVADIPFILLIPGENPETEISAFRGGVDATLPKPISLRSLITRVETLLWRYQQIRRPQPETQAVSAGEPGASHHLSGDLRAFNLLEIMQFMHMSKKSGTLIVKKEAAAGEVYFLDGEVVAAHGDNLQGEEAVYRMASWQEGHFHLQVERPSAERNIQKPTMKLILDCCSVLDMENMIVKPES